MIMSECILKEITKLEATIRTLEGSPSGKGFYNNKWYNKKELEYKLNSLKYKLGTLK
jgi:hypothetical protein